MCCFCLIPLFVSLIFLTCIMSIPVWYIQTDPFESKNQYTFKSPYGYCSDTKEGYECFDGDGNFNAVGIPAIKYKDGTEYWFKNGKHHREDDLPAIILPNGNKYWYKDGEPYRENNLQTEEIIA